MKTPLPLGEASLPKERRHKAMIVQIYETQQASEAQALEAVGVDHIGVLVGASQQIPLPRVLRNAPGGGFAATASREKTSFYRSCCPGQNAERQG